MISPIPKSGEIREEDPHLKHLRWSRSVGELFSAQMGENPILFACPSPRTSSDFHTSIYDGDYSYFSELPDETR